MARDVFSKMAFGWAIVLVSGAAPPAGETLPGPPPEHHGIIRPFQVAQLGMAVEGRLREVLVDRGDKVEAGQVLASLDLSVEETAMRAVEARAEQEGPLRSAEARFEFNRTRLEHSEPLFQKGVISQEGIDEMRTSKVLAELAVLQAREELRIAAIEYERARAIVERGTLRSPFRGVVTDRFLSPGEMVQGSPQPPVLRIAQIDPLLVEVILPSDELGRHRVGEEAAVFPMGTGGGPYAARIRTIDPVVDAGSDTFGIRLELPNPRGEITAGLRCRVRFAPRVAREGK
jgi:membrane fusion protein (multidrug efflux system)